MALPPLTYSSLNKFVLVISKWLWEWIKCILDFLLHWDFIKLSKNLAMDFVLSKYLNSNIYNLFYYSPTILHYPFVVVIMWSTYIFNKLFGDSVCHLLIISLIFLRQRQLSYRLFFYGFFSVFIKNPIIQRCYPWKPFFILVIFLVFMIFKNFYGFFVTRYYLFSSFISFKYFPFNN